MDETITADAIGETIERLRKQLKSAPFAALRKATDELEHENSVAQPAAVDEWFYKHVRDLVRGYVE